MNREAWSERTDAGTASRRAGGRRGYNARRQFRQARRRLEVVRRATSLLHLLTRTGEQARLAAELGVSRSTICRDVAAVMAESRSAANEPRRRCIL